MEEVTCPNCNVDIDAEELRQNNLCCPTCGFDLSERDQDEDDEDVTGAVFTPLNAARREFHCESEPYGLMQARAKDDGRRRNRDRKRFS